MNNAEIELEQIENKAKSYFKKVEDIAFLNQQKVLNAFFEEKISGRHFEQTTGYGYDDLGRDALGRVFARIFKTESALVSPVFSSGTHAISTVLFALLRPGDCLLSITGKPYDTLDEIIKGGKEDIGSLKDFNVKYEQIELLSNGEMDESKILSGINKLNPKIIFIQRSRGYSARNPIGVEKIGDIIKKIRKVYAKGFIVVDNCYGEFVEEKEPSEVGTDVCVGSLIKNPGGGIAPTGGYIAGTKKAVELVANRLYTPSLGSETGSYAYGYKLFFQGLFLAPHIVSQSIKGMILLGETAKKLNFKIFPDTTEPHLDIIKSIEFDTKEKLIEFCGIIQRFSPVDSYVTPIPWAMPGYADEVIMAAGCFNQGSSIELSCDAPIRKPYIVYVQGGLTYEHVKLICLKMLETYQI